jgi:hypothetical protein
VKRIDNITTRVRSVEFTHPYHTGKLDDQGEAIDEVQVTLYRCYTADRLTAVRVSVYGADDFGMAQDWAADGLATAQRVYEMIVAEAIVSEASLRRLGLQVD